MKHLDGITIDVPRYTSRPRVTEIPTPESEVVNAGRHQADRAGAPTGRSALRQLPESGETGVLTKLCDEIDAHAAAEEEAFYPVVRDDVPSGKKLTKEAKNEHGDARQLIGRIRRTSDPDHVVELVNQLEQAVNHHVVDEEEEVLPLARRRWPSVNWSPPGVPMSPPRQRRRADQRSPSPSPSA